MSDSLQRFKASLASSHYSNAFVQHLSDLITSNTKITTLQQIYELIEKESALIIDYFGSDHADLQLIEYRSPLCFESLREYFHTMIRGVYRKYGSDIARFREGLTVYSKELIEILSSSTSKIVKQAEVLLKDSSAKKVLVFSCSKSIALTLKRLAKSLEDNLEILVCKSGSLEEGVKLYDELAMEGLNCSLINDNEVGYYIHEVTCVLVGAEVILDNGAILNRAGTSIIALLARQARKPFYVFAESYKFLRRTYLCQRDIPQRFRQDRLRKIRTISIDLTLPEYITMFCTESGLYNPEVIAVELSKILK